MKIAVIGGGINGLCCAWALAEQGHNITLFEKDHLMDQTSSASSKLLHGGLRYLEQLEFKLVRESLQERRWWLDHAHHLTRRLPIIYPLYQQSRSRWKLKIGLMMYDLLAGKKGIGRHRWLTAKQVQRCSPSLLQKGLKGGYLFFDGQMDDKALGLWVADRCIKLGVDIRELSPIKKIAEEGRLETTKDSLNFDRIINVAGPWSVDLLEKSGLRKKHTLDLIRGSHLMFKDHIRYGHMLEVPGESRIFFVLPYQKQTLIGTTEVQQNIDQPIQCSDEERNYLLAAYNHYFDPSKKASDICREFSGLRPLIRTSDNVSETSREYQMYWQGKVLTVAGGKWTTARALGKTVARLVATTNFI